MTKKANKSLESVQTHKQISNKNKVNQQEGETRKNRANGKFELIFGINPSQRSLGENDSLLLRVSLAAPSDAKYGVTSTVTVFVSQDSGFTKLVNFMVLFVTVASKVSETEEKISKL